MKISRWALMFLSVALLSLTLAACEDDDYSSDGGGNVDLSGVVDMAAKG